MLEESKLYRLKNILDGRSDGWSGIFADYLQSYYIYFAGSEGIRLFKWSDPWYTVFV